MIALKADHKVKHPGPETGMLSGEATISFALKVCFHNVGLSLLARQPLLHPSYVANMLLSWLQSCQTSLLKQAAFAGCGLACLLARSVSPVSIAITLVQVWASSIEKISELSLRVSRLR